MAQQYRTKPVMLSFRIDDELRDAIARAAEKDQRSVSGWLTVTLRRVLSDAGT